MSARPGMAQASHTTPRPRNDTAWQTRAACHGLPDEYFFPPPKVRISPEVRKICGVVWDKQKKRFRATSDGCPVRAECLAYALNNCEDEGVWGGLSAAERAQLKRQRKAKTS